MSTILQARVEQKKDTEVNWLANPLVLLSGECAFVMSADGVTPINFKIGDGTKTFSQLPYWINYAANVVVATVPPGSTLPAPTPGKLILLTPGTYTQPGGGTVTAPANQITFGFWDGTTWSLISFDIGLSLYALKTDLPILGTIGSTYTNLQNPANNLPNSYIQPAAGSIQGDIITLSGGIVYFATVSPNTQYTLSGYTWPDGTKPLFIRFENSSGAKITPSLQTNNPSPTTFTTPAGCVKIYYPVYRSDTPQPYSAIQLETGATAHAYTPYGTPGNIDPTNPYSIKTINGIPIYSSYVNAATQMLGTPTNPTSIISKSYLESQGFGAPVVVSNSSTQLQNPANAISGQFINYTNGLVVTLAGGLMYYTAVTAGQQYTLSGYHTPDTSNKLLAIRYENSSGGLISFSALNADNSPFTFTAPAGCVRVLYSVYRSDTPQDYSQIMLNSGATALPYAPYIAPSITTNTIKVNGVDVKIVPTVDAGTITTNVLSSDRIAFGHLSYDEGAGVCVKNKSTLPRVSQTTNFHIYNFGVGGDRIADATDRIKRNTASLYTTSGQGIQNVNPKYVLVKPNGNEVLNAIGVNSDLFRQELEDYCQAILSIGAKIIFSTDYFDGGYFNGIINNYGILSVIKDIAKKYGAYFHDNGVLGEQFDNMPSVRKWGSHWDTRANEYYVSEYEWFLKNLYDVEESVKIFRPRSGLTIASVQALNYDSIAQRIVKLAELTVGNYSLKESDSSWTYMDQISNASSYSRAQIYTDEYLDLMAKKPVPFTDYAVVDWTLKTIKNTSLTFYIYTASNANAHFYLKNYFNSNDYLYPAKGNQSVVISVDLTTYNATNLVVGDIYTTPVVKNSGGTNINLVVKGKFYSLETGYILAFETQGKVSPVVNFATYFSTAGTLTLATGTGTSSIAFANISPVYSRHSFEFLTSYNTPLSSLTEVTATYVTDHYEIVLSTSDIAKYALYDNFKMFISIPSSFNITHIEAKYSGGSAKKLRLPPYEEDKNYTQKIPEPTFNTAGYAAWTWDAGITQDQLPTGIYRDYPKSGLMGTTNNHITLSFDSNGNPLRGTRTITVTPKLGYRKMVVYAITEVFPKYYRSDIAEDAYVTHTRQITPDSYDLGTMCVGMKLGNIVNVQRAVVGPGWAWKRFEFTITPLMSSFELSIFRDQDDFALNAAYPMWCCYLNLLIEGE